MSTALLLVLVLCLSVVTVRGAVRRRALEAELVWLRDSARVDATTMLANRRSFIEDLELELRRADRTGNPACLVVLRVEESVSREVADACGRQLADAMTSAVRASDMRYRIGTTEFALILPDTRARGGLVAARRLEHAVRVGAASWGLTAGVAETGPDIDRHQLFRNAYSALLSAGRAGRSGVLAYSPELERSGQNVDLEPFDEIAAVDGPVT